MAGALGRFLLWIAVILASGDMPVTADEKDTRVIVGLGDSTTAGTPGFLSPRESPPDGRGNEKSQYAYWLTMKYPDWKVYNRGVRGQRSDQILKRFEYDVERLNPDVVIVLAGVNDLHQGYSSDHVRENLSRIYDRAEQSSIEVLACTILPYNLATPEVQRRIGEVNEWIRSEARKRGMGFCDTYAALTDPENPGNLIGTEDEVHPDPEGYRLMAAEIGRALSKHLKNREIPKTKPEAK